MNLPPLRQDLALYPAPHSFDGAPAWHLHDPTANRFYRLDWASFEVLSRWHLGLPDLIVSAVNRETTLQLTQQDVAELLQMLLHACLVDCRQAQDSQRLLALHQKQQKHWLSWLLEHYLFFRVPLWRPMAFLDALAPWVQWAFSRWFWYLMLACLGLGLFLVSRQWDSFLHAFNAFDHWTGWLGLALALSFSKTLHEFGHAFAAHRAGCQVPSMGVAFLVMWPMLYTDVNESWKLPRRQQRLVIGGAGMSTEFMLAIMATLLWSFLPDGPLRAATFFLATSTWLITIAINVSPFLRFDGYFLLMDILGMENLHPRAFALGRWWMREKLFKLNHPPPEVLPPAWVSFMVMFAILTWLYRLALFLSIALLVYYFFFKALGIFLMIVELAWFIARPITMELVVWWQYRSQILKSKRSYLTLLAIMVLSYLATRPMAETVHAPAIYAISQQQEVYVPVAGILTQALLEPGQTVKQGQVIAQLQSPDLDYQLQQAQRSQAPLDLQVARQGLDQRLREQGQALPSRLQQANTTVSSLHQEKNRLTLVAPFDGVVLERNDQLNQHGWIAADEWLYFIGAPQQQQIYAYVGDDIIDRIQVGMPARFVPQSLSWPTTPCKVQQVDRVNLSTLDHPALAKSFGGPIANSEDPQRGLIPVSATFRIRIGDCEQQLTSNLELSGSVHIETEWSSPWQLIYNRVWAVLNRELGF